MKASTGPGKGVRTQGARAGLKGRLPSLASAFLPRRGDPQPRSDGVRRESDWVFVVGKGRRVPTAEGNLARMALHMALYLLKYPQAPQYVIFNFTMTVPCPVPLFRSLARSLSSSPLQTRILWPKLMWIASREDRRRSWVGEHCNHCKKEGKDSYTLDLSSSSLSQHLGFTPVASKILSSAHCRTPDPSSAGLHRPLTMQ